MAENIAESIMNGVTVAPDYIAEAALRCEIMMDIETIDADTINTFYQVPEKEGDEIDGNLRTE